MSDVLIRTAGRAGRITLNRPEALNALTWEMCLEIERALDGWAGDPEVALVVIDGAGERAFCAGGDIAEMYRTASSGDYGYGRRFWIDEYRLNAKIAAYPKPYVALMQGFTMGGGVGVSCHGSHRVAGATTKIAMPECGIGLVPDVGGTALLARAPGRLGEYLGTTGARMGAADAIHAGFADLFIDEAEWPALIAELERTGQIAVLTEAAQPAPTAPMAAQQDEIDRHFAAATLADLTASLDEDPSAFAEKARASLAKASPLAAAVALELVRAARAEPGVPQALAREFRVTWRSAEEGDFVEGIRAAIIDRDNAPRWRHTGPADVTGDDVAAMLAPLGADELVLGDTGVKEKT